MKVPEEIQKAIKTVVNEYGFDLVDIRFSDVGFTWSLRIFIDKLGGVTVEDCAKASREISDCLDTSDLIAHKYLLEVSSPGLDRPLITKDDFRRKIGKEVVVLLKESVSGLKQVKGEIIRLEEEKLILRQGNQELALPLASIIEAKIIF